MKRHLNLVFILVIIGALMVFASTRKHLWTQTKSVTVLYNGEEAPDSTVYKSVDGDLMIWVQKADQKLGVYCVLFRGKRIGKPYPNELLAALPFSYYVRNYPMENIVGIATEKLYPYATVRFEQNRVAFSLEKDKTIEVIIHQL